MAKKNAKLLELAKENNDLKLYLLAKGSATEKLTALEEFATENGIDSLIYLDNTLVATARAIKRRLNELKTEIANVGDVAEYLTDDEEGKPFTTIEKMLIAEQKKLESITELMVSDVYANVEKYKEQALQDKLTTLDLKQDKLAKLAEKRQEKYDKLVSEGKTPQKDLDELKELIEKTKQQQKETKAEYNKLNKA